MPIKMHPHNEFTLNPNSFILAATTVKPMPIEVIISALETSTIL